jgi:hypothetical protein
MSIVVEGCKGGAGLVLKSGENNGVLVTDLEIIAAIPVEAKLVCTEFLVISRYGQRPWERQVNICDGRVACPAVNKNCVRHE